MVVGIISDLNKKFGKESLLMTTCRKTLECLGITIDYKSNGKLKMSMFEIH